MVFDLTQQNTPKIQKEDLQIFKSHIQQTVSDLKSSKRRSIWFKIPQTHLFLLETMVQDLKFDIHHVSDHNKKANPYIMLCKWLETSERSGIPSSINHSHYFDFFFLFSLFFPNLMICIITGMGCLPIHQIIMG